jgi:hypothetical protein
MLGSLGSVTFLHAIDVLSQLAEWVRNMLYVSADCVRDCRVSDLIVQQ